jgi:hypothetical protein
MIYIVKKQVGSPINFIENKINNVYLEPSNVNFLNLNEKIEFGLLEIGDFLPIWLRREVFSGIIPIEDDGCSILTKALIEFKKL